LNETKRVIALGFFDGVHIGHGALIRRVTDVAAQLGAIPTALTFDPHPDSVILGAAVPLINTPADRADLMRRIYGIQEVIIARFDQRMMKMPWEEFVEDYLVRQRGVIHVVAGHDFHFGYKGMGNPERLREKCRELGIGCDIIEKVEKDGITVSSTYIRTLIAQGEIELANSFLGHPHSLTNTVGHGNKLGSTLGFPTVNLRMPPGLLVPAYGVYASRVLLDNGESHLAVTNVGVRPTVDDERHLTVEGFLLDFQGDLYGKTLRMEFYKYLREECKFPCLDALKAEIMLNVSQTREYFAEHPV
jgi:riboflavin kinase/FMN adenylyltransferase